MMLGVFLLVLTGWTYSLLRDLTRFNAILAGTFSLLLFAVAVIVQVKDPNPAPLLALGSALFGAFIVVSGGHLLRCVDEYRTWFAIPKAARLRYGQHTTAHQLWGFAIGGGAGFAAQQATRRGGATMIFALCGLGALGMVAGWVINHVTSDREDRRLLHVVAVPDPVAPVATGPWVLRRTDARTKSTEITRFEDETAARGVLAGLSRHRPEREYFLVHEPAVTSDLATRPAGKQLANDGE